METKTSSGCFKLKGIMVAPQRKREIPLFTDLLLVKNLVAIPLLTDLLLPKKAPFCAGLLVTDLLLPKTAPFSQNQKGLTIHHHFRPLHSPRIDLPVTSLVGSRWDCTKKKKYKTAISLKWFLKNPRCYIICAFFSDLSLKESI